MAGVFTLRLPHLAILILVTFLSGIPAEGLGAEGISSPVAELSTGLGVDRATRTLSGAKDVFAPTVGKVFCLVHVLGAAVPLNVTCVWYYEGKTMARVPLAVGSADFRTWSSKNILPAWTGLWEVKVLDPKGLVLGETSFHVEAGDAVAD